LGEEEVHRKIVAKAIEEAVLGYPLGEPGGPPVFVDALVQESSGES
jgi:hypothetical protein